MATKDEREKEKDPIKDVQPLGEYGTMGNSPRRKKASVTGEPVSQRTQRVSPSPQELAAAKVEATIENEAKAQDAPGLADTFKEIAPFLVATALGGLDAGFAAQRGAISAQAAQNEADLRRRGEEAKIEALGQRAALAGDTDPNSEASMRAREMLRDAGIEVSEDMSEADVNRFGRSLISRDTALIQEQGRQGRSEANLEVRKKGQKLQEEKFGFTKEKASQLSEKQTQAVADFQSSLEDINRLNQLKQSVDTGPLAGPTQSFLEMFDAAPREFTQLKAASSATTLKITKQLQGSRPSDMDLQFVQRITPDTNDNDQVFAAKLDLLTDFISKNKNAFEQAIATGQPLRKINPNMSQDFIANNAGSAAMDVVGIKPVNTPSVDNKEMSAKEKRLLKIRELKERKRREALGR